MYWGYTALSSFSVGSKEMSPVLIVYHGDRPSPCLVAAIISMSGEEVVSATGHHLKSAHSFIE